LEDPDGRISNTRSRDVSFEGIDITFFYGDYLEVEGTGPLTLIPPSLQGPPELQKLMKD
jgi:hypothetical protein